MVVIALLGMLVGYAEAWCSCQWTDGQALVGGLAHFHGNDTRASPFNRLPAAAKEHVSMSPWSQSRAPAGAFLQYTTDSTLIYLNMTVLQYLGGPITNLDTSLLGWAGIDVYARATGSSACNITGPDGGCWRWTSSASSFSFRGAPGSMLGEMQMQSLAIPCATGCQKNGAPPLNQNASYSGVNHTFRLHLPTHVELQSISIGVPIGATLVPDRGGWQDRKPIAWYGTSILQCTGVSRPGQCVTNQVSRLLDREVYNFGYNGCGTMEITMAKLLVQIERAPALFIIDCSWNMDSTMITERAAPLVKFIRGSTGSTPILLVSGTPYRKKWLVSTPGLDNRSSENPGVIVDAASGASARALATAYKMLVADGVQGLSYLAGSRLFDAVSGYGGSKYDDPTFNSIHPNDLGHTLMAEVYRDILPRILSGEVIGEAEAEVDSMLDHSRGASTAAADISHPTQLSFDWTSMEQVTVVGRAFNDTKVGYPFSRLPGSAQVDVREEVWNASLCSAGIALRFVTNASKIALRYETVETYAPEGGPGLSWIALGDEQHWAMSGLSGVDLYAFDDLVANKWRFVSACSWIEGCGMVDITDPSVAHVIADGLPDRNTMYMLHLPLYNGITTGQIGAFSQDGTARIEKLSTRGPQGTAGTFEEGTLAASTRNTSVGPQKSIVWYGTSILQGAMAGRPGHQFTNVISRELDIEIFNEGFSASGTMEISVVQHLVAIQKPVASYIIDCVWNMNPEEVAARTAPLVKYLRANGTAGAAIVLVEGTQSGLGWASTTDWPGVNPSNVALSHAYAQLVQEGVTGVHYVHSSDLYARAALYGAGADVTMGGVHPGDVGTRAIAEYWIEYLPAIL